MMTTGDGQGRAVQDPKTADVVGEQSMQRRYCGDHGETGEDRRRGAEDIVDIVGK